MLSFLKKKVASCALDYGTNAVKMVQIEPGKVPSLVKVGSASWTVQEQEDRKQAGARVRELLGSHEVKDKVFISSLHGHSVIIKRVSFTADSAKKLPDIVQKEAKQYIPFDINDVYLDYGILSVKNKTDYDLVLVACKRVAVDNLERLAEESGAALAIVDVDAFALSNCYEFNYYEDLDTPVYLLDIGASQSVFCAYQDRQPSLVRDVPSGGNRVTEGIARGLNIRMAEAEQIKINGPDDFDDESISTTQREVRDAVSVWVSEIRRAMMGHQQAAGEAAETISTMYISGGGSLLPGLAEHLSEALDLEVRHLDPWRKIKVNEAAFDPVFLKENGPKFVVATGLALRSVIK